MKNPASVHHNARGAASPMFQPIEVTMSVASSERPINPPEQLDSIRRFFNEIEKRSDAIEIASVEWALWDITLENENRRRKAPPVPLPRVRRIDS